MSVAVSYLQTPANHKYSPPAIKQSYDVYKANLTQLMEKKAEETIAYKHPRDAVKDNHCFLTDNEFTGLSGDAYRLSWQRHYFTASTTDGRLCPINYQKQDPSSGQNMGHKPSCVEENGGGGQILSIAPLTIRPRLSFEPPKQYYAPPTMVAPKISSLKYEFRTESQWRSINPYWTTLLEGLTEKLKAEFADAGLGKKHFLAYALEAAFKGLDFGFSEDTIELRLKDVKKFICLKEVGDFVKGDILIAEGENGRHSAIYFGEHKVMASLGKDKSRPRYMDLVDFINHPRLASYTVYRFAA